MAASAAVSGFGTTFSYLSTDPSTFTALGEVISISGGATSREVIDATHMASDDGHHEFVAGLFDVDEITVLMNYTEAGATLCETLMGAGKESFKVLYPGGSYRSFSGIPTGLDYGDAAIDDKLTIALTIKPTGKSTFTAA